MTGTPLRPVGSIAVVDLEAICEVYGHYTLPFPLGRSRPVGSAWLLTRGLGLPPVEERLSDGDLSVFRTWIQAYVAADIWVECRVSYTSEDAPDRRMHAFRAGESGFLATQRPDQDVVDAVDISTLSAYDLGAAIAESVGLTRPGSRARILVPSQVERFGGSIEHFETDDDDDHAFTVRDNGCSTPTATVMNDSDVRAVATVQSRCDPAREGGVNVSRKLVVLLQIQDDGDYICTPDLDHALPATPEILRTRIDQLIAEDVAVLRQRRENG